MTKLKLKQCLYERWMVCYGRMTYTDYLGIGLLVDILVWGYPKLLEAPDAVENSTSDPHRHV